MMKVLREHSKDIWKNSDMLTRFILRSRRCGNQDTIEVTGAEQQVRK